MKKLFLILLPILLIVGIVVGLAFAGIINIPFITHKKKKPASSGKASAAAVASAAAAKPKPKAPSSKPVTSVPAAKPIAIQSPPNDIPAGQKKLAKLWDSLDASQLLGIVSDWKDPDLAKILVKMDEDKVAELLAALDPKRASQLSRAIQDEAAKPPPGAPSTTGLPL